MNTPKEGSRARLEQDSSVTRITASSGLVNGSGLIAVQGQRKLQMLRLLTQSRQNRGVAPVGENNVGVFPFDLPPKSESGGFACFVRFPTTPIHFEFSVASRARCGSN